MMNEEIEPKGYPVASLETRQKIVLQAQDILDREGWCTGTLYRSEEASNELQHLPAALANPPSVAVGYCAIGALRQAMVELAVLEDENDWRYDQYGVNPYEDVREVMGWANGDVDDVYYMNDGKGRLEAFDLIESKLLNE